MNGPNKLERLSLASLSSSVMLHSSLLSPFLNYEEKWSVVSIAPGLIRLEILDYPGKQFRDKHSSLFRSARSWRRKTFYKIDTWGQCYKTFYHSNLLPFHGNTTILCYKAILPW